MHCEKDKNDLAQIFVENILITNRDYNFYVNWNNINSYKEFEIEFHAMDVLIRNDNIKDIFFRLLNIVPSVINTFPFLFALSKVERENLIKNKENLYVINNKYKNVDIFNFSKQKSLNKLSEVEIDKYYNFFSDIGLKNLFENLLEKSVVDYVIGVLVGLDSNGRKNRSGSSFENICEDLIAPLCEKYEIKLLKQIQFKKLEEHEILVDDDIKERKPDFLLIKDKKVINIEANYYFRGGSKPEEIVESYINRNRELKNNKIDFILITDGQCWDNEDKSQLKKAFKNFNIMNIYMVKNGYLEAKIKEIFNL